MQLTKLRKLIYADYFCFPFRLELSKLAQQFLSILNFELLSV